MCPYSYLQIHMFILTKLHDSLTHTYICVLTVYTFMCPYLHFHVSLLTLKHVLSYTYTGSYTYLYP